MKKKELYSIMLIFLFLTTTFSSKGVIAQDADASSEGVVADETGTIPSFFDDRVRYASYWCSAIPVRWYNLNDSKEYELSAGEFINAPNSPQARVITSDIRKVGEEYLDVYKSFDGRDVICKEYTMEFDVCVYTLEDYQDFFGTVNSIDIIKPLWNLEVYVLPWGSGWVLDPSKSSSANIEFRGYDLTHEKFQEFTDVKLEGSLIWQINVETALWSDVFGDRGPLIFKEGNWTFGGEVYSSVRAITCVSRSYGMLENNSRPTVIRDPASRYDGGKEETDPVTGPTENELGSMDDIGDGQWAVHGYYMPYADRGPIETTHGEVIDSDAVSAAITTFYGLELTKVIYWGTRGYDPDNRPADTVFFETLHGLRPRTTLYEYQFAYHWEEWGIQDWSIFGYPYQQYPKRVNNYWETVTVGYELLNFYTYNTYQFKVVVGAYYDWQPLESSSNDTLVPPGRENGNNTFPIVVGGSWWGGAILPPGLLDWIIWIVIGIVAVVVIIIVIRKLRRGGGKAKIEQTIQIGTGGPLPTPK